MTDRGLSFWLRHVADQGGLWEPAGDSVLVVLPAELSTRYQLAEELSVTSDPDVAREDGVTFLGAGHPVLTEAAESVLDGGDVGIQLLDRPASMPADDILLSHARTQLPISHGRIDLAGPSGPATRWLLRLGALVSYAVSAEDMFQERIERWVDVASRREVPAGVVDRVCAAPAAGDARPTAPVDELGAALAECDRLIEMDAVRRRTALARQLGDAYDQERARATSYYADAIAGIERRMATAAPDRKALLEDRLTSTREEQQRRLAEIAEKHQARHDIRPYLLHLVGAPARRLPVEVRRGERRYPLELDWLAVAGVFAEPRCPSCSAAAPLVASKTGLGCLVCRAPAAPAAPPPRRPPQAPPPRPVPKPKGPKPNQPEPKQPEPKQPEPKQPEPARPEPKPATAPPAGRRSKGAPARSSSLPPQPQARPPGRHADRLAAKVWNAVAERRRGRLRDAMGHGSPAAALERLYGADGPKYGIGMPPDEEPIHFTSVSKWLTDRTGCTVGAVATGVRDYPYALHWSAAGHAPTVVEVLAYPPLPDGHLSGFYWILGGWQRLAEAPVVVAGLDEVARLLVTAGIRTHGMSVTARALAAWWRLDPELVAQHEPALVAAAVHRLVASRAGDKGRFRDVAHAFEVDEAALRRADTALRKQLALGPGSSW